MFYLYWQFDKALTSWFPGSKHGKEQTSEFFHVLSHHISFGFGFKVWGGILFLLVVHLFFLKERLISDALHATHFSKTCRDFAQVEQSLFDGSPVCGSAGGREVMRMNKQHLAAVFA